MTLFKNTTIAKKLIFSFFAIILAISISGYFSITQFYQLEEVSNGLSALYPMAKLTQDMEHDINEFLLGQIGNEHAFESSANRFETYYQKFILHQENHGGIPPDEQPIFNIISATLKNYKNNTKQLFNAYNKFSKAENTEKNSNAVLSILNSEIQNIWSQVDKQNELLYESISQLVVIHNNEITQARNTLIATTLIAKCFTLVVACLFAFYTFANVSAPIVKLKNSLNQFGQGSSNEKSDINSNDEIGQLATAFNNMVDNLIRVTVSKDYVDNIIQSMSEMLIVMDENGNIKTTNKALLNRLGYQEKEVTGQSIEKITIWDEDTQKGLKQIIEEKTTLTTEKEFLTKDGTIVCVLCSASAMKNNNNADKDIICIAKDLTELNKVESLKSGFISTVSHELRTPLTAIRGALDLISSQIGDTLPRPYNKLIPIAQNNTARLLLLINDLLDLEKIASGTMRFDKRSFDILPLINKATMDNQIYGAQYKVTFKLDEKSQHAEVFADRERLEQVMANLLSNAAKFAFAGSQVTILVKRMDKTVRVSVHNKGDNIPDEFRERIFQRFAQADSSDSRQKAGTGLGLSICKTILDNHDGNISFTSQDQNSTFSFELPVQKRHNTGDVSQDRKNEQNYTVLHIENESDCYELVRLALHDVAHVINAKNLEQAKQKLKDEKFDLIILDIELPDGSGEMLLPTIEATQKNTPVIPYSELETELSLSDQVNATLLKSKTPNVKLIETVKRLLENIHLEVAYSGEDEHPFRRKMNTLPPLSIE